MRQLVVTVHSRSYYGLIQQNTIKDGSIELGRERERKKAFDEFALALRARVYRSIFVAQALVLIPLRTYSSSV